MHPTLHCMCVSSSWLVTSCCHCPGPCVQEAGQPGAGSISAGFTALCSSYQQLAGTGIGVDVLEAAATPLRSPQVSWLAVWG